MPAQWPIFINNVSGKMSSRTPLGPDDFGMFVANEYFNAVKTAQTPYGNIHVSGTKSILEEGFKKAFNELFDSIIPELEDKKFLEAYSDMFEEFPEVPSYNAGLEFEKWVEQNSTEDFRFYEFFKKVDGNSAPTPTPITENILVTSTVVNNTTQRRITFKGLQGGAPYTFKYSIDGKVQPEISTTLDSDSVTLDLPEYIEGSPTVSKYKLISVVGKTNEIGIINQSVDVIMDNKIINTYQPIEVPSVNLTPIPTKDYTLFYKIPNMSEDVRATELAKRVYYQFNGSAAFIEWVKRMDTGSLSKELRSLAKKVKTIVLELLKDVNFNIDNTQNNTFDIPTSNTFNGSEFKRRSNVILEKIKNESTLSKKIFQMEYINDTSNLPEWIDIDAICTFVYIPEIDDFATIGFGTETTRRGRKVPYYFEERDKWNELKLKWAQSLSDDAKKEASLADAAEINSEDDPYSIMAECIINYWKSTVAQPFKKAPPVPPCNVTTPGTYTPIYYGSKSKLAADLRRAWNTGKSFKEAPTISEATKAVATAVAVSHAKHLSTLKFIYVGQLKVGKTTIPMIGVVPTSF